MAKETESYEEWQAAVPILMEKIRAARATCKTDQELLDACDNRDEAELIIMGWPVGFERTFEPVSNPEPTNHETREYHGRWEGYAVKIAVTFYNDDGDFFHPEVFLGVNGYLVSTPTSPEYLDVTSAEEKEAYSAKLEETFSTKTPNQDAVDSLIRHLAPNLRQLVITSSVKS